DHWASDQCYRILGLDQKQDRFDLDTWCSVIHPEDYESVRTAINRSIDSGLSYSHQYRLLLRDGQERTIIEAGEPISEERYVGTMVDITDRVRMERNFAEAQRIARLGSWEVDEGTGETRWSDAMYQLFGIPPGARAPGA